MSETTGFKRAKCICPGIAFLVGVDKYETECPGDNGEPADATQEDMLCDKCRAQCYDEIEQANFRYENQEILRYLDDIRS